MMETYFRKADLDSYGFTITGKARYSNYRRFDTSGRIVAVARADARVMKLHVMDLTHLPYDAPLADYVKQTEALLAGWEAGDEQAVRLFRSKHPKFLDAKIPWLERHLTDQEVRATLITREDASLALARWYDFADWQRVTEHVEAVTKLGSPVGALRSRGRGGRRRRHRHAHEVAPRRPRARAREIDRVTHFDPSVHGAMLLHYLAANAVEGYRQRSPRMRPKWRECCWKPVPIERAVLALWGPVHDDGAAGVEHAAGSRGCAGCPGRCARRSRRLDCAGRRRELDVADRNRAGVRQI